MPAARTNDEAVFIASLAAVHSSLQWWPHDARDGSPWLIVSYDFVENGVIRDTLRLDFDGKRICGGWSPAFLNWDDGVPAGEAGVDLSPPDGISRHGAPADLALHAGDWFASHIVRWWTSERRARWSDR